MSIYFGIENINDEYKAIMSQSYSSAITRPYKGDSIFVLADNYVCIDIETTGFSIDNDKIIEIGAVRIDNGQIIDEFDSLINIGEPLSNRIINLTGITDKMLENAPDLNEALASFLDFIKSDDLLVGHNINFDVNFIYDSLVDAFSYSLSNSFVDTLKLSQRLYDLQSYKLESLIRVFGISENVEHRALSDCINTYKCYEHMKKYIIDNEINIENLPKTSRKKFERSCADIKFRVDIKDKQICLTGNFKCAERKELEKILSDNGAVVKRTVTKKLDYLIISEYGSDEWKDGKGTKHISADNYNANGGNIAIINESEFLELTEGE